MSQPIFFLRNLEAAFLCGKWTRTSILRRVTQACAFPIPELPAIVKRVHRHFEGQPPPKKTEQLVKKLQHAFAEVPGELRQVGRLFTLRDAMNPFCHAALHGQVPAITSSGTLSAWLGVDDKPLHWLADARLFLAKKPDSKLQHHHRRWIAKRNAGYRLIETPKARLKAVQRKILREIVDRVPAHDVAHGFRVGRSALTHASLHVGRQVVIRFDLADFFTSVRAERVARIFRVAGYPSTIARMLASLCTTTTPAWVSHSGPKEEQPDVNRLGCHRLIYRHLLQGAPTSPALANLCAY